MKTNSKLKLGLLTIALALCPLLASEKAFAQTALAQTETATGVLSQTGTGLTTFNLPPGNSVFQLDLNVTTNFNSFGITYFLVCNDGSGLIAITNRSYTAMSPWPGLTTSNIMFTPPYNLLNPVNDYDLGGVSRNLFVPVPPGSYFVNTLTLTITGAVAGQTYHIVRDQRDIMADASFADVSVSLNTVTINILPAGPQRKPH